METNTTMSAKRITALLCAVVFIMSFVLSGCGLFSGKEDEKTTTTTTTNANQALGYIDPTDSDFNDSQIACPACGSINVDEVTDSENKYDEHYICYDCGCEWYVDNGTAYQIADNGVSTPITTTRRSSSNGGTSSTKNPSSGSNSSNKTNPTTSTTTKKGGITLKDVGEVAKWLATGEFLKYVKWYIDEDGNITTEGDKGVLGFAYSSSEKCFYATGNSWQRNFGYSDLYDRTSQLIAISYDTSKIFFIYDNKEWMVQLWKGQYGLVLLGGEVGLYNRPIGSTNSYFDCAKDADLLPMDLLVEKDGKQIISRKAKPSWWMTGFVAGQMGVGAGVSSKYTKTMSLSTSITFKDEQMRKAFVIGLKKCSFIYNNVDTTKRSIAFVEGDGKTAQTYSVNGNTVTLSWQ